MQHNVNALGQPIGFKVSDWQAPNPPSRKSMKGNFCLIEPLSPGRHARSLFESIALDADGRNWSYLSYGPFGELESYRAWLEAFCCGDDPLFYAILEARTGKTVGLASYCRINPRSG